ncbi:hypothetical protein M446_7036 (plasmid) [Methylobacterium sp. 4-46]|nr:hypothetical protein M446_7036 [Methylobacterium sp. 4-46]
MSLPTTRGSTEGRKAPPWDDCGNQWRADMNTFSEDDAVKSWIHNAPQYHDYFLFADNVAATAGGTFLGENTADPNATGTAIYTELSNLPTAVSSILKHSQKRANFHPATTSPEVLAAAFNGYVTEIDNNPFLALSRNTATKMAYEDKNYNALFDQICSLYAGLSEDDLRNIEKTISDMAKSVSSENHSEEWKNLFSQSTINMRDPSQPKLYLYYTALYMSHDKSKKKEVARQGFEVRCTEFSILTLKIKASAGKLVALDTTNVTDWLRDSTSPTDPNVKLCFQA